jgi:recombination protein RecT
MAEELTARPQTEIEATAQKKLVDLIKKYEKSFQAVLPKEFTLARWQWLIINSIRKTPALAGTKPTSFMNAVMLAANLQVEIRDRSAYLIPFGDECQLLLDYRAKIDLAARAGWTIKSELVRETDDFDYSTEGSGLFFRHKPNLLRKVDGKLVAIGDNRGQAVLGYAYCECLPKRHIEVMSIDEIERIRKRSRNPGAETTWVDRKPQKRILTLAEIQSLDYSTLRMNDTRNVAWARDWDRMALKTLVHRAYNGIPTTPQMATSQEIDAAHEKDGERMPVAPQMAEVMFEIEPADDLPMLPAGSAEQLEETRLRMDADAKTKLGRELTEAEMAAQTRAAVEAGR